MQSWPAVGSLEGKRRRAGRHQADATPLAGRARSTVAAGAAECSAFAARGGVVWQRVATSGTSTGSVQAGREGVRKAWTGRGLGRKGMARLGLGPGHRSTAGDEISLRGALWAWASEAAGGCAAVRGRELKSHRPLPTKKPRREAGPWKRAMRFELTTFTLAKLCWGCVSLCYQNTYGKLLYQSAEIGDKPASESKMLT